VRVVAKKLIFAADSVILDQFKELMRWTCIFCSREDYFAL